MGGAPSAVVQLALLVLVVLPGVAYESLREFWRGPAPAARNLVERVMRALAASVVLDALYLVAFGPQLVRLVHGVDREGWSHLAGQTRLIGLAVLGLLLAAPAAAAAGVSTWERRRVSTAPQRGGPSTAWDRMFHERGSCFVRLRLRDGVWIGGRYGDRSYASSSPHAMELYLESAWLMRPDGSFDREIHGSGGLYVRAADADVLEIVLSPAACAPGREHGETAGAAGSDGP